MAAKRRIYWVTAAVVLLGALLAARHAGAPLLEWVLAQLDAYAGFLGDSPLKFALVFAALYVVLVGAGLPLSVPLGALAGGAFGPWWGSVLIVAANTLALTLTFGLARYFFRDRVRRAYPESLAKVDGGVAKDGPYYLFLLRLAPVLPFTATNVCMALTSMPLFTYVWVSVLGRLPVNVLVVYNGSTLAGISHPRDVLSWELVLGLALLGVLPLAARLAQRRLAGR